MDQETANAIAELRRELGQLRSALGVSDPDEAEVQVGNMRDTLGALVVWGGTVTPPFVPPAQG
jgi:hypothetical protein